MGRGTGSCNQQVIDVEHSQLIDCGLFQGVETVRDGKNYAERLAIVIVASGMCDGGRIVNYLKALHGDRATKILFIGYQAKGTPRRIIQH